MARKTDKGGGYGLFAVKRIAQAIVVVLLAYGFTFFVLSVLPGDPISSTLRNPENGFTEEEIQKIVAYHGLDQPLIVQLWNSLTRFLVGDLGLSLRSNLPVSDLVADALPSTLALAGSALVIAIVLAVLIAFGTQVLPVKYGQGLLRAFPSLFLSVPNFVIGLLLINLFAFGLGLFRIVDAESGWATFFAALSLGIPVSAQIAEVLITNLDHASGQEYASVARSRGLTHGRLFAKHLLKPSALPTVTVLAITVGELLGGSLITESVFGRNGIGSIVQRAVSSQDLPVLQAVVGLAAVVFVLVNLLADLAYPLLDPRVDINGAKKPAAAPSSDRSSATAVSDSPLKEETSVI